MTANFRKHRGVWLAFAALLVLATLNFLPVYQVFQVSVSPMSEIITLTYRLWPAHFTSLHYHVLFKSMEHFGRYFINSLEIATLTTLFSLTVSALAGYSLARMRFRGRDLIGQMVLLVYVIPPVLLIVPIYNSIVQAGLKDTIVSVVLSHALFAVPFCTWLLRGFFAGIPGELEEAAMIDGLGRLGILARIVLPLSLPGLVATALFAFIESWNEFMFASILIDTDLHKTLPVGVYALVGTYGEVRWGELMAASVIMALPMVILFLVFQRWLIQGLTAGAVKG